LIVKTVFKYPLAITDGLQQVVMPGQSRIVHVGNQDELPTLWAEVQVDEDLRPALGSAAEGRRMERRTFFIAGTGHHVPEPSEHVGTVLTQGGRYVWHIYEFKR
jgi:hypothetical protein